MIPLAAFGTDGNNQGVWGLMLSALRGSWKFQEEFDHEPEMERMEKAGGQGCFGLPAGV